MFTVSLSFFSIVEFSFILILGFIVHFLFKQKFYYFLFFINVMW